MTPRTLNQSGVSKVLLLLAGVLLGLLGSELLLRLVGVTYPRTTQPDYNRGHAYAPNAQWMHNRESKVLVTINSKGFNDRERDHTKPAGTFRIAVLGDSYVAALQISRENRFTELLERHLNRESCLGAQNVEIMNFGVSDYGTAQELMVLRRHVWQYDPDMVMLAFWPGNDLNDNSKELSRHANRPFAVIQNGKVSFDFSFRSLAAHRWWRVSVLQPALDRSRTLQVLNRVRHIGRAALKPVGMTSLMELVESPRAHSIYYESNDVNRRRSWEITDSLITMMHREVVDNGASFYLVGLGTQLQVTPDIAIRNKLLEYANGGTLFYPGQVVKAIGKRQGFSVLDLAPGFQAYADEHNVYLHGYIQDRGVPTPFGHWNEEGHRLAARLIADDLCSNGSDVPVRAQSLPRTAAFLRGAAGTHNRSAHASSRISSGN